MGQTTDQTLTDEDVRAVLRWDDEAGQRRAHYMREGDTVQLGRGPDNDVVLNRTHVSRHHGLFSLPHTPGQKDKQESSQDPYLSIEH